MRPCSQRVGGDGRTDVSKFPPVFYRTSALWGRCPKRRTKDEEDEIKEELRRKKKK